MEAQTQDSWRGIIEVKAPGARVGVCGGKQGHGFIGVETLVVKSLVKWCVPGDKSKWKPDVFY